MDGSPSRPPNLGCCSQGQKWRLTTSAGSSPCLSKGVGGRRVLKPWTLRGPVCRGHVPHSRSSARTSCETLDGPTEPSRTAVFSSAKWEEWRTYLAELPHARHHRTAGAGRGQGYWGSGGRELPRRRASGPPRACPAPRGRPGTSAAALSRGPSRRSSQLRRVGAWHERAPYPWSVPQQRPPGRLRPGQRTQRRQRGSLPCLPPGLLFLQVGGGRGGASAPSGAQEDSAPAEPLQEFTAFGKTSWITPLPRSLWTLTLLSSP